MSVPRDEPPSSRPHARLGELPLDPTRLESQAKISADLGERVRQALEALLIARRPVLEEAWDDLEPRAVYLAACQVMMRLVVVLFGGLHCQKNCVEKELEPGYVPRNRL